MLKCQYLISGYSKNSYFMDKCLVIFRSCFNYTATTAIIHDETHFTINIWRSHSCWVFFYSWAASMTMRSFTLSDSQIHLLRYTRQLPLLLFSVTSSFSSLLPRLVNESEDVCGLWICSLSTARKCILAFIVMVTTRIMSTTGIIVA